MSAVFRGVEELLNFTDVFNDCHIRSGSDAHHEAAIDATHTILPTADFSVKGILKQITEGTELSQRYLSRRDKLRKTLSDWLRIHRKRMHRPAE